MKYYMLDIETTGTEPESDDIIQVGILELAKINGYYVPGRAYSRTLHTTKKGNEWVARVHKDLLAQCKNIPPVPADVVRAEILRFFKEGGETGPATIMGINLMSLDVPFLIAKGMLRRGDYHYRVRELKQVLEELRELLGVDEKTFFELTAANSDIQLPAGKAHEALFDCYNQAKILNGAIKLVKQRMSNYATV